MSNKSGTSSQVIALPPGGGALQGLGETFSPDLFSGTGHLSIPIALPPGRNGLRPELMLDYCTGYGHGPFGFGWSLGIPQVSRKTSAGVPKYFDTSNGLDDLDTFVLAGSDDLVRVSAPRDGVTRFRPRTEGQFSVIDRVSSGDFWRVRTRDGLVSVYGSSVGDEGPAVVANPNDRTQIFSWKLSETRDSFGNLIQYRYVRDSGALGPHVWDQLDLERIDYVDVTDNDKLRFLVSVSFNYDVLPDEYAPGVPDRKRIYPFSDYRAGFEVRTRKRCSRIDVHTDSDGPRLVRSYRLEYADQRSDSGASGARNGISLLSRLTVVDHEGREHLAPLEFEYAPFEPSGKPFLALGADGILPPAALGDEAFETLTLFGNALPDVVQLNGSARFWRNLGNGLFAEPEDMSEVPVGVALKDSGVQLADLNGDGRADLLVQQQGGYFPLSFKGRFQGGFTDLTQLPTFDLEDKDVRLVDLNGDGIVDIFKTDSASLHLFFNDPVAGFTDALSIPRVPDLDVFPNVDLGNPHVKLADLTGDSLQDIVLVEQGSIRYWPYLGDGRWGRRIDMRNSPLVDDPVVTEDGLEPTRLMFGDLDGDGLDDAVYVQNGKVTIWINQNGSGWSDPIVVDEKVRQFNSIDDVRLVDMLGLGASGLLWTFADAATQTVAYDFLDLTGAVKPYLLNQVDNHMGAITRIQYVPSTAFYRADQEETATRWKTPLPSPVHVLERTEVIDELSKGKLASEFRYHHGYWNGAERELRGFGMVERIDTETFERFNASGLHGEDDDFVRVVRHFSPPTLTKTWFHLGGTDDESDAPPQVDFTDEFFQEDPPLLDGFSELGAFGNDAVALRALRGNVLRTEVYALDGTERANRPFSVTESAFGLREIDHLQGNAPRQRVLFPFSVAGRTTFWERGTDGMTRFTFTEDFDEFGQPRRQTDLSCPRGWRALDDAPGEPYLATHRHTEYARSPIDADALIMNRVARSALFEIVNGGFETVAQVKDAARSQSRLRVVAQTLNFYDGPAFVGLQNGDAGMHGALVRCETLVMTADGLKKAFDATDVFPDEPEIPTYLNPEATSFPEEYPLEFRAHVQAMPGLAGFVFHDRDDIHESGYFATSTRSEFDFQLFGVSTPRGLLRTIRGALGTAPANGERGSHDTSIEYAFDLLPATVTDPAGMVTHANYDSRLLQVVETIDPNGNRTHYGYTPIGLLNAIAVLGKEGEFAGDETLLPDGSTIEAASTTFEYDFRAFLNSPLDARVPAFVRTRRRVHHIGDNDVDPAERDQVVETVEYSDGFGRLLQTRSLVEDDTVGDPIFGRDVLSQDQSVDPGEIVTRSRGRNASPNVVVSGARVFDNKGRVVEAFESYFELESGFEYRSPTDDRFGQKITTLYDALGRVVRTIGADGSEQRVIHGVPGSINGPDVTTPDVFEPTPWERYTYDANDLAPVSRVPTPSGASGLLLTDRAPSHHHFTPSSVVVDPLGRTVLAVARNRVAPEIPGDPLPDIQRLETRTTFDILGNVLHVVDASNRDAYRWAYDLGGRVMRSESLDGGARRMVFDAAGNEIERRDSKGALQLKACDRLHRLTRVWARDSRGPLERKDVTLRERLEYGDAGDRDENRALNRLGALHRHHDEAGLVELLAYDFKGNVLEKRRRVVRDEAVLAVFPDSRDPNADWRIRAFRVNWEPLLEQELALLDVRRYETSTTYDALNRVRQLVCPRDVTDERRILRPLYNRAGALQRIALDDDIFVEHIGYDARGRRTLIALGNGVMTQYAYDATTSRLGRMCTTRFSSNSGGVFHPLPLTARNARKANLHQDFGYAYDLVGNISAIHDRTPDAGILNTLSGRDALDRLFGYDALYRLTSATGREVDRPPDQQPDGPFDPRPYDTDPTKARGYDERYVYDEVGNLETLTHHTPGRREVGTFVRAFDHVSGSNRLEAMTTAGITFDYGHDPNGNLSEEGASRHFEWDEHDRMRVFRNQTAAADATAGELAQPSVYVHYLYDASGALVKKIVRRQGGLVETTECIDSFFEFHRESDGQNNTVLVMDGQTRIAAQRIGPALRRDPLPDLLVFTGDHLSSSNVALDRDGLLVNREEYTAYGDTSFGSFGRKRYRFTGRERCDESGLYHQGARYYAPWTSRWMSCDPMVGDNPYAYCNGNPLKFVDPDGKQPVDPPVTPTTGEYRQVAGDHVHQVASRTDAPGAKRTTAAEFRSALSISTADPSYRDKAGQKVESAINRAMWGSDYDDTPADIKDGKGRVHLKATGNTSVGRTKSATPSVWFEDVKSYYKVLEAGLSPDNAFDVVVQSSRQLEAAGATPKRVPVPPSNTPRALKTGQTLSVESTSAASPDPEPHGGTTARPQTSVASELRERRFLPDLDAPAEERPKGPFQRPPFPVLPHEWIIDIVDDAIASGGRSLLLVPPSLQRQRQLVVPRAAATAQLVASMAVLKRRLDSTHGL